MNREIGDSGRLLGYRAGLKLIKEKKIDAIFSPSDFISFGLVDAYRKNGIKLGKDILLISYDNLEGDGLLPFGKAILTTVANPRHEIGRIAADLAQSKSSGAEIGNTHIIRVKTNLIRRQTA
jgi:DNA-binding LacI/PurR family transcriptional regulator